MKYFFHKKFNEDFLRSERLRVITLLGIFLIGFSFAAINHFFNSYKTAEFRQVTYTAMIFMGSMTVFEFLMFLFVRRRIRDDYRSIPLWLQYLNAFIEISSPTIIMIILAGSISSPAVVLSSPAVYLYFIFIVISTLRLDFKITLFISIAAALEFFVMSSILVPDQQPETFEQLLNSFIGSAAKTILILLAGLCAAFVAHRIRREIDRSLAFAEKGSKIINLFGQQISKEIVDEMLETNGSISSKLMRVCVMFVDIRDFTSYVSGKTPAQIVSYQNAFFSVVINIVTRHKGIINQFLGDGCMVTFGAPVPLVNPSLNAIRAALEIRKRIAELSQSGEIPMTKVGIGMHVGEAVTGNIGTELRQQYNITGSVVIIAARIEQLNKQYKSQILASADVIRDVSNHTLGLETINIGEVNLKGWSEPVAICRLA